MQKEEIQVNGILKDGGTTSFIYKGKQYCIDRRIRSKTKERIYDAKHPRDGKLVSKELEEKLLILYKEYTDKKYKQRMINRHKPSRPFFRL